MTLPKPYQQKNISTKLYFQSSINNLNELVDINNAIIITDENVFEKHSPKFKSLNTIVINAGEEFKVQETVNSIIEQLVNANANRKTFLIGIGGGVVTDITGYVASVFMRGISFGFIPTTILGLVDASIGGKNGVNVGLFKNIIGTINQPKFILHDISFLKTLPVQEWSNGFAEIIKHAAIGNKKMFAELQNNSIKIYQKDIKLLGNLLEQNAKQKLKVVAKDVYEKGDRKHLNFGHTLGHAVENTYQISHGQAISIGMHFACKLSEEVLNFSQTKEVNELLVQYSLPTHINFKPKKVFDVLVMDKKREQGFVHFILLEKIGKAVIKKMSLKELKSFLISFSKDEI